jgi:formate dehydrogenase iron-sulfur subunit
MPSCAKACPTGAIEFSWNREELVKKAQKEAVNGKRLYGADYAELGLHVMHLLPDASAAVYRLPEKPSVPVAVLAWKKTFKSLAKWGIGLGIAAAALHYISIGPNKVDEEGGDH